MKAFKNSGVFILSYKAVSLRSWGNRVTFKVFCFASPLIRTSQKKSPAKGVSGDRTKANPAHSGPFSEAQAATWLHASLCLEKRKKPASLMLI